LVDAAGRVMHFATNNITWTVISGPGIIQGTGNGDPHCHEPNNAPWHSAYHGLVRAVVRVSSVVGLSARERTLLSQIDHDGPMSMTGQQLPISLDDSDIVVEATCPGFDPVRLSIPTTADSSASVLKVAEGAAGKPVDFFGDGQSNMEKIATE
jgi:hypothetical protein